MLNKMEGRPWLTCVKKCLAASFSSASEKAEILPGSDETSVGLGVVGACMSLVSSGDFSW